MKKFVFLACVALFAVACEKTNNQPTPKAIWYGEYATKSVGELKFSASGMIPEMSYDIDRSGTLRIDSIAPNRVRLTDQDSISREGTISGNQLIVDEVQVDSVILLMTVKGTQTAQGLLSDGVLTLKETVSGSYDGEFKFGETTLPISGTLAGNWTTVAIKK